MTQRMDFFIHEIIDWSEGMGDLLSAIDVVNELMDDNTGKIRTSAMIGIHVWRFVVCHEGIWKLARKYTISYTRSDKLYNDYNTHLVTKPMGIVGLITDFSSWISWRNWNAGTWFVHKSYCRGLDNYRIINFIQFALRWLSQNLKWQRQRSYLHQHMLLRLINMVSYLKCFAWAELQIRKGAELINVSKTDDDQLTYRDLLHILLCGDANNKPATRVLCSCDVGINYHALDSLISLCQYVKQAGYTIRMVNFSGAWLQPKLQ